MRLTSLFISVVVAGAVSSAGAMDGKAAVILLRQNQPFYGPQLEVPSRLMVSTVSNNSVTQVDTLLRGGPFYFPTWSFDGTRIAFYRKDGGVSIIDDDGQNLRTVAMVGNWGGIDQEQTLAWPAVDGGKWLYYHRPCSGCQSGGSGEIWKVNVEDTAQKVLICDYKKYNSKIADEFPPMMLKFSLSADATHACVHTNGSVDNMGYSLGIIPHSFPPTTDPGTTQINPNLTEPDCTGESCYYRGDCNSGLSPSGNVLYHLRGGHCQLYAHYWEHDGNTIGDFWPIGTGAVGTLDQYKDIETWLPSGTDVGACFIYPRGTCNSDQIVTIILAYQYSAGFGHSACGSNVVVANWKDKEAVLASNNPEPPHPNGYVPDGETIWLVDPGDFWLAGGPSGCYEDTEGNWVTVDAGTGVSRRDRLGGVLSAGTVADGNAAVYTLTGKRIGGLGGTNTNACMRGAYIVAGQGSARKTLILDNRATSR